MQSISFEVINNIITEALHEYDRAIPNFSPGKLAGADIIKMIQIKVRRKFDDLERANKIAEKISDKIPAPAFASQEVHNQADKSEKSKDSTPLPNWLAAKPDR